MAYTPRARVLMQSRKTKKVTHHPSHPCYQLCDWYNWLRVTDPHCWILWPPAPLAANHLLPKGTHTETMSSSTVGIVSEQQA